jgi:hypothetical protein
MADDAPTLDQERIAREGTLEEQLVLAADPDSSDAVLVLLQGAPEDVLAVALNNVQTIDALEALLEGAPTPLANRIAEQKRIAEVGTEEQRLALAEDRETSDAVLLLLRGASGKVVEAALNHTRFGETLDALLAEAPESLVDLAAEQRRIAQEGTEGQQLALANDPDTPDAVLLLLTKAPSKVVEAALKHASADRTLLALLNGKGEPDEWHVKVAAPLVRHDATLLGKTFRESSRPSQQELAAKYLDRDVFRIPLLRSSSARVRLAAVEAMKSAGPLRAHLQAEESPGVFQEQARNIRNVAEARIKVLEAPQQASPRPAQVLS